jgi:hypothetical protein
VVLKNPVRDRVVARLEALGWKPSSAVVRDRLKAEGLNPTYLYEFVSGKKDAVSQRNMPVIARVLQTTVDALAAGPPQTPAALVQIEGVCEEGAWRDVQPPLPFPASIPVHSRYPVDQQHAFLVIGAHAEALQVQDASVLVCVSGVAPRLGDIVVVRRRKPGGDIEYTARRFDGETLYLPSGVIETARAEVIGPVIMQLRTM